MKLPLTPCNQAGARLLLALALLIVTYLALTPAPLPLQEEINDKLGHLLAFWLLAALAHAGWARRDFDTRLWLPLLAYGLAIECIQYFIPNRFFSWLDLLADGAGLLLYALLLPWWRVALTRLLS